MSKKKQSANFAALSSGQRDDFAGICADAKRGFEDVLDLVLIHNERSVRGLQPRTTLNRVISMLSVATWERFVFDAGALARVSGGGDAFEGPGSERSHAMYLGAGRSGAPTANVILGAASGGQLPTARRVRLPRSGQGKRLAFEAEHVDGHDTDLALIVDWWVMVRHGVAHRGMPQLSSPWVMVSDAEGSEGRTINTTTARMALALFLQLIDQSIRVVADAAGMSRPDRLWLPEDWLSGQLKPTRGVIDSKELLLWHGPSLSA